MASYAQQPGQMRVLPKQLAKNGELMLIEMVFDMSTLQMRSIESITYTPIIVGQQEQYELPKLIIKGSGRLKADRRAEALSKAPPVVTMANQVGDNRNYPIYAIEKFNRNLQIVYSVSVAYRNWMDDATVSLREETSGCCNEQLRMTQSTITFENPVPRPRPEPIPEPVRTNVDIQPQFKFNYIVPEQEIEKKRYDIGKAFLEFPQGGSAITPSYRNNTQELDKVNQMIFMISSDPDVVVTNIEMRGYASPEGSSQKNYELARARATAMRDYFARMLTNIPSNAFLTGVGGEDWDGLKTLLSDYNVDYKSDIILTINTVQDLDVREQRIVSLGNGAPYRQIYRDLYPQLRRVDCQVNYNVRNFTIEEGRRRLNDNSKLLSQYEMYQVAQTYPQGSHEFNQIFITAGRQFPDNEIANQNAASASLAEGNPTLAEEYLKKVQNTSSAEYANCMGALCTLKGDYRMAEEYFIKAHTAGSNEATHNLRELEKKSYR
jgi:outer membrane protein OmpA-like peptidoglycan-associated protein